MRYVILDWSGVIKDAFKSHLWVVNKIFSKYGIAALSEAELRNKWQEPFLNFYQKYIPGITLEEEIKLYKEGLKDPDYPVSHPFPGIIDLVKALKNNGCYLALITSDLSESLDHEIEVYGLRGIFNDVVFQVHDKSDALSRLIKSRQIDPQNCLFVGDSDNEINAAGQNGVKSVFVNWGFTDIKNLKQQPDFVAYTITDLQRLLA